MVKIDAYNYLKKWLLTSEADNQYFNALADLYLEKPENKYKKIVDNIKEYVSIEATRKLRRILTKIEKLEQEVKE